MKEPLHILHLEDCSDDADLIKAALAKAGLAVDIRVAATRDEYLDALNNGEFDLVLSDGSIPGLGGLSALETARNYIPGIPFIFVSGAPIKEEPTEQSMTGAGYVPKTELERLAPLVAQNLRAHQQPADGNPTELLIDVIQQLSQARDLETLMAIVRHAARELTGADGATFILRERDICFYAEEDTIVPFWKGKRLPMSTCISGWVMLHKQPAVIEDIYADPRVSSDAYRPTFVKSLAMVPIRAEEPFGAIGNYWATPHRATEEELKLLQALANSAAIAMENVERYNDMELRIIERTAQLGYANKELEAFSYSISHDLRTPLRHINGFSQLLLDHSRGKLDATELDYLERIQRASLRMSQLIEDMLKLSRIARSELNKVMVDLSRLAREIALELLAANPERSGEFDITDGISVCGDPGLLRVVLEDLFSNAWKFTANRSRAQIHFGVTHSAEGKDVYCLRDNGVGFDMALADKLFAPFQRLHSETEFPGTGVGLATVQRIVRKHGGHIWAEAVEGEGASFFFTLE